MTTEPSFLTPAERVALGAAVRRRLRVIGDRKLAARADANLRAQLNACAPQVLHRLRPDLDDFDTSGRPR